MQHYAWLREDDMKTGESAWSLIHRFCYRNGIGFLDLIKILNECGLTNRIPLTVKMDLRTIQPGIIDAILHLISRPVDKKNMLTCEYLCEPNATNFPKYITADWLRYCPVCIQSGTHLTINQFLFNKKCAVHPMIHLMDTCHKCGVRMPYLPPVGFLAAFSCTSCGTILKKTRSVSEICTWPGDSNFMLKTPLNMCLFSLVRGSCIGESQLNQYLEDAEAFLTFDGSQNILHGQIDYSVRTIDIFANKTANSFEIAYTECSSKFNAYIELAKISQGALAEFHDFAENIYHAWRLYWENLPSASHIYKTIYAPRYSPLENLLLVFNNKYPPTLRRFLGDVMSKEVAYHIFKVMIEVSFLHHIKNEQWHHNNKCLSIFSMNAANDGAPFFILNHSHHESIRAYFFIPSELQSLSDKLQT